jgi:hypothetical protein
MIKEKKPIPRLMNNGSSVSEDLISPVLTEYRYIIGKMQNSNAWNGILFSTVFILER